MALSDADATLLAALPAALAAILAWRQRGNKKSAIERLIADLTKSLQEQYQAQIIGLQGQYQDQIRGLDEQYRDQVDWLREQLAAAQATKPPARIPKPRQPEGRPDD